MEIQDHHEGYVSWDQYLANLDQLQRNRVKCGNNALAQSAREGLAILQGLLICSQCGHRLTIRYQGNGGIYPTYECGARREGRREKSCLCVSGRPLDKAITERLPELFNTDQLHLALAAQDELTKREATIRRQWEMRLERATYEANLVQRRYEQVDPENRLVASSLEQRWNAALERIDEVQCQMEEFGRRQTRTFTREQRERILALALASFIESNRFQFEVASIAGGGDHLGGSVVKLTAPCGVSFGWLPLRDFVTHEGVSCACTAGLPTLRRRVQLRRRLSRLGVHTLSTCEQNAHC